MHFLWIIGGIAAGIGFLLLGSWAVQALWNWLSPTLRTPKIEFKHAIAILLLSRLLFGGFGGSHFGRPHDYANGFNGSKHHRECSDRWGKNQEQTPAPLSIDSLKAQ